MKQTNTDEADMDKTNTDETNTDKTNADKTNTDKTNTDETNRDEVNIDIANIDKANRDEANRDEANRDKTNMDEINMDEINKNEKNTIQKDTAILLMLMLLLTGLVIFNVVRYNHYLVQQQETEFLQLARSMRFGVEELLEGEKSAVSGFGSSIPEDSGTFTGDGRKARENTGGMTEAASGSTNGMTEAASGNTNDMAEAASGKTNDMTEAASKDTNGMLVDASYASDAEALYDRLCRYLLDRPGMRNQAVLTDGSGRILLDVRLPVRESVPEVLKEPGQGLSISGTEQAKYGTRHRKEQRAKYGTGHGAGRRAGHGAGHSSLLYRSSLAAPRRAWGGAGEHRPCLPGCRAYISHSGHPLPGAGRNLSHRLSQHGYDPGFPEQDVSAGGKELCRIENAGGIYPLPHKPGAGRPAYDKRAEGKVPGPGFFGL